MSVSQTPEPPAAAYTIIAKLLHPSFFLCAPPPQGVEVFVAGRDGIVTCWAMTDGGARALSLHASDHPDLQLVQTRRYDRHTPIGDSRP